MGVEGSDSELPRVTDARLAEELAEPLFQKDGERVRGLIEALFQRLEAQQMAHQQLVDALPENLNYRLGALEAFSKRVDPDRLDSLYIQCDEQGNLLKSVHGKVNDFQSALNTKMSVEAGVDLDVRVGRAEQTLRDSEGAIQAAQYHLNLNLDEPATVPIAKHEKPNEGAKCDAEGNPETTVDETVAEGVVTEEQPVKEAPLFKRIKALEVDLTPDNNSDALTKKLIDLKSISDKLTEESPEGTKYIIEQRLADDVKAGGPRLVELESGGARLLKGPKDEDVAESPAGRVRLMEAALHRILVALPGMAESQLSKTTKVVTAVDNHSAEITSLREDLAKATPSDEMMDVLAEKMAISRDAAMKELTEITHSTRQDLLVNAKDVGEMKSAMLKLEEALEVAEVELKDSKQAREHMGNMERQIRAIAVELEAMRRKVGGKAVMQSFLQGMTARKPAIPAKGEENKSPRSPCLEDKLVLKTQDEGRDTRETPGTVLANKENINLLVDQLHILQQKVNEKIGRQDVHGIQEAAVDAAMQAYKAQMQVEREQMRRSLEMSISPSREAKLQGFNSRCIACDRDVRANNRTSFNQNLKEGAFLPTMANMKGSRGGVKNAAGLYVAETRGQPTQGNQRRHFQSLKNASPPRTRSPPALSTAITMGTNPRPWTAQSRGIREVSPSDSPISPRTFISQGAQSLGPSPALLDMSIRPSPSPPMAS